MNGPKHLRDHEIDQALGADEEIVPTRKFKLRVMEAVRSEAAAPPMRFPWALALPGPVLSVAALIWGVADAGVPAAPPAPSWFDTALASIIGAAQWAHLYAIDWLSLACGLAWMSWKLSVRLAIPPTHRRGG